MDTKLRHVTDVILMTKKNQRPNLTETLNYRNIENVEFWLCCISFLVTRNSINDVQESLRYVNPCLNRQGLDEA